MIKLLSQNSYCDTMSQSVFVSFGTHMAQTEMLFVSNVQVVKGSLLQNKWQIQHYLAYLQQ